VNENVQEPGVGKPDASDAPAPKSEPSGGAEQGSTGGAGTEGTPGEGTQGTTQGPPRPKRRRGRRGGKRHRRPGTRAAGAPADAPAEGSTEPDAAAAEPADGSGEAPAAKPARQQAPRQRRPAQPRQRTPRPPREKKQDEASVEATSAEPAAGASTADADEALTETGDSAASSAGERPPGAKRRRRRGGRGRGRSKSTAAASATENGAEATADAPAEEKKPAPKRAPAAKGSTRLEARQQRAQQRPRRRPRRLTGEEAKRLRGSDKVMVIHEHGDRTQIAVLDDRALIEHYVAHGKGKSMAGNVYLGRVQNVLAGMEAAFVDIGRGRNAVLYAGEVNYSPEDLEGESAPRIEKILKPGQAVLVQVTKDPLGTKGARLTAQISLAGRYLVLAPEQQLSGISRRLAEDERARLRQILRSIRSDGHGVIVRTAAEGASEEALRRDLENLLKIWNEIKSKQKKDKAPSLLYEEPELVMRVARDIFSGDFAKVVVDSKRIYETLRSYLDDTGPDLLGRLELYEGSLPIFEEHHVAEQIHKALERKVWLPSGGSIVIDRTEAMTVIDVNTSKFVGKGGSLEETVFKNNLEAAEEVARQLRLRDIGGIIVIDFIDMIVAANREQVLRTLKRALSRDKTRSQVFDVSSLGLVEMTRKKVSEGLLEAFSEPCPNCEGRGIVITHEID
jgi:ribonuclease E